MSTAQPRKDVRAWLQSGPSLTELAEAYPAEWKAVKRELAGLEGGGEQALLEYVAALSTTAPQPAGRGRPSRAREGVFLAAEIRRAMAVAALKQQSLAAATGIATGRVRFNLLNGYLAQKLLFRKGLERKPVSLLWFRLLWPLLWQRRLLLPLVQPKGIYCFYSRRLIRELAALVGDRSCLEIAAGDGTLSRFLADEGVQITATDDYSWSRNIAFPQAVVQEDAPTALRERKPAAVICSWPPPGNTFERHVFETPSVELYIVINAGREFGSGNRADYESQTGFEHADEPALGRLVLPPELGATVQVFRRRAADAG
jgi:hypothetical protein